MLMAVGFIVGWEVSVLIFLGGAISYVIAIPILAWGADFSSTSAIEVLHGIWDEKIRFFGIGAMVIAGLYSIFKIAGNMQAAVRAALRGIRGVEHHEALPRTEQGITGTALLVVLLASLALSGFVYYMMTRDAFTTAFTTIILFILAFFFVAVASYIVGLVGSSNSPVSGMAICTVLVTAFMLLMLGYSGQAGMLGTLGVAGVVCCAACTSGDICQDLKIGQIVGATPRRLQTGELIGTLMASFIIAPTMQLLKTSYGIVEPAREGVQALRAPQGAMFEKLVGGIFGEGKDVPWELVGCGAAVGAAVILIDRFLLQPRKAAFRLHAMPLAVGMYLPWTVTFPILFGGLTFVFVTRRSQRRGDDKHQQQVVIHRGLLFSSGLVAGEAIMGIVIGFLMLLQLDIPVATAWPRPGWPSDGLSLLALALMVYLVIRVSLNKRE
jgi:putative OPT family oligopeptide transporter